MAIQHPAFPVEPWVVRETALQLEKLAQTESVFALANGHLGLRANLDEGDPYGLPGTYLGGFYETRPLPYAEAGYGFAEDGQTVVNVTDGKLIRLLVDDEPFDIRYGTLHVHERVLDLRAGTLAPHRGVGVADRPAGAHPLDAPGVVHPAGGSGDRLRGGVARRHRAGRAPVRARGQPADAAGGGRSAGRRRARGPAPGRGVRRPRPPGAARPPHAGQRAPPRCRDGPRDRLRTRLCAEHRELRGSGAPDPGGRGR